MEKILKRIGRIVQVPLYPLEKSLSKDVNKDCQIIVILGPARSGTTLAYQCLLTKFKVGYINNLIACFPKIPIYASILSSFLSLNTFVPDFNSRYGKTEGLSGPNQGNRIFSRWFDRKNSRHLLSEKSVKEFRYTLNILSKKLGSPLVLKWPGFSAHIKPLMEAIPDIAIIRIKRNPFHTAKSIFKGRIELTGSSYKPISRDPRGGYVGSNKDPFKSVCEYIYYVEQELDEVIYKNYSTNCFEISYSNLCEQPNVVMYQFHDWYRERTGRNLIKRLDLPDHFSISEGPELSSEYESRLKMELRNIGIKDF